MDILIDQPTAAPTRKVGAGAIGSLIAVGILAALDAYIPGLGELLSEPVYGVVAAVAGFLTSYFVREKA